jgi:hypothetical protein
MQPDIPIKNARTYLESLMIIICSIITTYIQKYHKREACTIAISCDSSVT